MLMTAGFLLVGVQLSGYFLTVAMMPASTTPQTGDA